MMSYFATECIERSQTIAGPCGDFFDDWIYPVGHSMSLGSMKVSVLMKSRLAILPQNTPLI